MKEQISIPTGKVQRASKFVSTGAKLGGNYLKYYSKKILDPAYSRDELDEDNAEDIYESLSHLKGSALKVAQMMSMDQNFMPRPFAEKFALSQYSAPPLSAPLVTKTFKKYFGKSAQALFDTFTMQSVNAASIGQVHKATLGDKVLAVKIQYPGVSESVSSDLKMVRPFAQKLFNISTGELDKYMSEVESKLLEETDYTLELSRSLEISQACNEIDNLYFPNYYPDLSCERILTMDWLDGYHLKDFVATNPSQEVRNKIGQALWDFYDFQIHKLKQVHADPHPGNFLMQTDGTLGIIDFGCVKVIPADFYASFFQLFDKYFFSDAKKVDEAFYKLEFLSKEDTQEEKKVFREIFVDSITLLGRPFHGTEFDFSDDTYFEQIFELSESLYKNKFVRNSRMARGSQHGLYINRTYFGLYMLLHDLGAKVKTRSRQNA